MGRADPRSRPDLRDITARRAAEDQLRQSEEKLKSLICDIGLPGMDGYAVARAFRGDAALARTHLVALTGYDRHLAKPASPDELRRTLAEVPVKGEGTCGGCR